MKTLIPTLPVASILILTREKLFQLSHLWNKLWSDLSRDKVTRLGLLVTLSFPQSWFCCGRTLELSQCWGEQQVLAPGNPSPTFSLPCELENLIPAPKWKNFAWQKSLYYASSSILPLLAHASVLSRETIATPQTIYSIKDNLLSFVSSFPASEAQERKICWFFKTSDVRDYL